MDQARYKDTYSSKLIELPLSVDLLYRSIRISDFDVNDKALQSTSLNRFGPNYVYALKQLNDLIFYNNQILYFLVLSVTRCVKHIGLA